MAKSSPRRSLKSLFSRSEVNLNQSSEKDKNDGEKKKFRFPKFKIKSKNDSDSAPVKAVNESKELLSTPEPSNTASDKKRASLYATAPRSKGKEFSYSELDLRKPKRFATFSFGFKKKKKNDETTMSKSTFSLQSDGIEEQEEGPLDLSQMELDQTNAKTTLGMSQPALDTTGKFGIPSPPPVAISQSYFSSPNQSEATTALNTQPEVTGPLTNGSSFEVHKEPPKAPIATIPELQLSDPDSPEESENIPVYPNADPSSHRATSTAIDDQTVLSLAASQPPTVLDTSDDKAAFTDSDGTSNTLCDNDILHQPHTKTDISHTESTRVTLSPPQSDATDETDITTESTKHSLASVDSKIDSSITESTPVSDSALDSASVHQEVSIYRTERTTPETATGVPTASAVSDKKTAPPVSQDGVYEALYESLFPHSFTSEVESSFANPPPQIHTEMRHLNTKSEPVLVKTRKECHTETNVIYSRLPASHEFDSTADGYSPVSATSSDRKVISSSQSSRWTSSEPQRDLDINSRYSLSSSSEPGNTMSCSVSKMKSDRFSLIQDNVRSVPMVESSAPPVSDYVTSQGKDTRVTDSKRRAILVKELVTEETSRDPVCPSLELNKMSATQHLEIQIETRENFFAPSGQMDGSEGPLSPAYLSIGSDDGSIMEVYYSAEEDNTESEEMYTVDEREASSVGDSVKEAWLHEESPQQQEVMKRDEGEFQLAIVKMQNEGGTVGHEEVFNSRIEVEQQVGGQRSETEVREIEMSERLVSSDAESLEKEIATRVLPQIKEEGEEKLPATPVQQVNMLMVCNFAPPSSDPHGQEEGIEGNQTQLLETEDHPNGGKQLPSQEIRYLAPKDIMSSEHITTSTNTKEKDEITPTSREAEEQVLDRITEASKFGTETGNNNPAGALTDAYAGVEVATLTHSTELQSDATGVEYNRPPQSSEWVDTFTRRTDRTRLAQEQVAVKLSVQTTDTHRPDPKAAETPSERHPTGVQPHLNQGTLTAASVNQPPKADKESVDEMNSGVSSLSTKLSLKNSFPPKEDEYKYRFHKMSLVSEANNAEDSQDTVDFSKTSTAVTESNRTEISSDYKWRNRFEGVSQYKPYKMENLSFSDSLSNRMSDSSTSTYSSPILPEATVYKHLKNSSSSPEERITLGNRLSDMTTVYESHESEPERAPRDEWRRSLVEQEEPVAPAGEREGQRESERIKSGWDSQELPVSGLSSAQQTSHHLISRFEEDDDSSHFTGVFKATLVELVSEPAALPSTPPASPEAESPYQFDMDNLVDTLKSMGPSLRPRNPGLRGPPPVLISSLPPIVEDAPSPHTPEVPPSVTSPSKKLEGLSNPAESLKGLYTLPDDLGLKRNSSRDTRSPLELMKQSQQDQHQPGTKGLTLPLRASASNSILMRKSSDSSPEELKSPVVNGNGLLPSSNSGSRLDHSVIFGSHRSASTDQTLENGKAHRSLFRTGSLPDVGLSNDRMSVGLKEFGEHGTATKIEPAGSRFERFSFLLNSPPSSLGSLTGVEDHNGRMSRPPLLGIGSPPSSNSPTRLMSPTGSIDFQRPFTTTDSPLSMFSQTQGMGVGTGQLSTPILQRSFSSEGTVGVQQTSLFNNMHGGSQFQSQQAELEKNIVSKYRAFPDAYLTKEKEHGKLNPRPGKMYIFDRPGMCGQRIEVRSDVIDATPWELQETISIRVIRGGWVLYEKPNFKGEKIALDEGDTELTFPFSPAEEPLQNGQNEGEQQNEGPSDGETKPVRRFIIGSLRRAVRDYSVPEISLFPEENAEGKKVIFRDTSDDARIFGFPIKANSIIINAGLWLVFAHPFFQGAPRVLEVGGYSNPAAWGVEQPYVGSVHPLKVGEPRVENMTEPKMVIYDKPYFSGKSRTITTNMRDFMTRIDRQQTAFMYSVGSLKVQGGIWVGYEKEGFRGHQYLLEEGEYHDWRVWGGCDAELRSVRVIRADLTEPIMVMFEQPEEEEEGMQEENTFEVTEAIPDVELFEYKTSTRSIHVLSGAWIAYSHVDFSGNQYILEKGFYNNCADWGSQDTRICSVQPILLAPREHSKNRNEIILYSEPDFQGKCHISDRNQEELSEKLLTKSCRVSGGSWVLYENTNYSGNLYVLSEGDYPNFTSMGCPSNCTIRSAKVIPMMFSVPSISLFGLECLEGREITMETEIYSMVEEGFNNHILSVRVNRGCWVICEHSNYRGRQFLLEPIEITNWPKFSSIHTIGSMFPIRQKRHFMRIKNKASGHYLSIQGGVEEMKSGRVVVTAEVEPMSDIWFYQDGLIKSKLSPTMSLQVMGNVEPAAKVVLWSETRQPIQTWTAQTRGLITSLTFPGCVLDVKGGKTYDKDHVVIMPENDERPSQQWEVELL